MPNSLQKLILKMRPGAANAALALVVVFGLGRVTTPVARAQALTVLHDFGGTPDGAYLQSDVTLDKAGHVFGTAAFDGTSGLWGDVFELIRSGGVWQEHVLYNFTGGNDGGLPSAGLTIDKQGNLFGTTMQNGPNGNGVVFELKRSKGAWKETVIHAFPENNGDGGWPVGDLTFDDNGNVYGTANIGGTGFKTCQPNGCGIVFRLSPQSNGKWKETVLHRFAGGTDGGNPYANVILDKSGNLYGTTFEGGGGNCSYGCGVVFELAPQSNGAWKETILHRFSGTGSDGAYPYCNLTFDRAGNLYGTTSVGGVGGAGIVFELTASKGKWREKVLFSFTGGPGQANIGGSNPVAGVTLSPSGKLYGTADYGGINAVGVVFQLEHTKAGWNESALYNFSGGTDGSYPMAGVTLDKAGNIFGTTSDEGENASGQILGSVFEVVP